MSFEITFVTSNGHKYEEARRILGGLGVDVKALRFSLSELQSDSTSLIAGHKARSAEPLCDGPFFVEDDALEITSLNRFPGTYSSYVLETIGLGGILRLLEGRRRLARFHASVWYRPGGPGVRLKSLNVSAPGSIAREPRGEGWGYDPIFVPRGGQLTFAQLEDKDSVSHRGAAMRKLAERLYEPPAARRARGAGARSPPGRGDRAGGRLPGRYSPERRPI